MAYQIGQIQFEGSGCMNSIGRTITAQNLAASQEGSEDTTSFQDVLITPSGGVSSFDTGTDYYLHLEIPRDINYSSTFNIKLVKSSNVTSQSFQFIKQVTANRGGDTSFVHDVVLYDAAAVTGGTSTANIRVDFPRVYDTSQTKTQKGAIYHDDETNMYYLGTGSGYVNTNKINPIKMSESWRTENTGLFATFDCVFRPVESGFNGILLEMVRTTEDYSIQETRTDPVTGTVSIQYGRKVDIDELRKDKHVELFSLNNLVDKINKGGDLARIGVWSHPGLMMAINGEEIKVGPSAYYEEDVVPVSSLGIVARDNDYRDQFTVDYTYDVEEEE